MQQLLAGENGRRGGRGQRHVGARFEVFRYGHRRLAEAWYGWLGLFESLDIGGDVLQVRSGLRRWRAGYREGLGKQNRANRKQKKELHDSGSPSGFNGAASARSRN
jgi:hypothetical protein